MEMDGNGKFWKLTYIRRGGVKCVNQNFPQYIVCDRKNFEKFEKNFFDFENFEMKKGKRKYQMIELVNGIILFIIFSIFCVYLCLCIIEELIGKK